MTVKEYEIRKKQIKDEHDIKLKNLGVEYAMSHNPYGIGDTFEDHIGKIVIQEIKVISFSMGSKHPSCAYIGHQINKDGSMNNLSPRYAYQVNDIKIQGDQ